MLFLVVSPLTQGGQNSTLAKLLFLAISIFTFLVAHFSIVLAWSYLSILSLSYSCTLRVFWGTLALEKGRTSKANGSKYQARKIWIKQLQQDNLQVSSYMYDFPASIGMHGTCMHVFGSLVVIGMGFSRCDYSF